MWVNKTLFEMVLADNKRMADDLAGYSASSQTANARCAGLREQKAKDDLSIDWLRHRVNALEKEKTIFLGKSTGLNFPVPEIVPTRPGTISDVPVMDSMPNFEDVGDDAAQRLGITHDDEGVLAYTK